MYVGPGTTSVSRVLYLQDAVTGGAYTTEDQADWTFSYIREGDASATQDATITAGTLGTWADGTAKPFGTTGLWQIDFADAAFAAGINSVVLLVTHDNGDFLPKMVHVDLNVRQADAVEISGGSTEANRLRAALGTGNYVAADAVRVSGGATEADRLQAALGTGNYIAADVQYILAHQLTQTGTQVADGFEHFFNVGTPTGTVDSLPAAAPGATGGLGVRGGAIPDAAADAAGGLPISDAGGLDLDAILADTNELEVDWKNGGRLDLLLDNVQTIGAGSITHTHTVYDTDGTTPLADVEVWVSSNLAGTTVIAGPVNTDTNGKAVFHLDAGTYYFWHRKSGKVFGNDPDTEAVS